MKTMKALIIVDPENDFFPGGALEVKGGDQIIKPLNRFVTYILGVVGWLLTVSRDWHPKNSNHFKKWPVHCVQDTFGAEFHSDLNLHGAVIFSKGMGVDEDAYSAFDGTAKSGDTLEQILTANRVIEVYVGGLATDYCVKATALDALKKGFDTVLLTDACRAVNIKPDDGEKAIAEMVAAGAILKTTEEVTHELDN